VKLTGWSNIAGAYQFAATGSASALGAFQSQNAAPQNSAVASDAWTWYVAAATLGDKTLQFTTELAATSDDDARYSALLKNASADAACDATTTRMTTDGGATAAATCRAACAALNAYVLEGAGADRRQNLPSPTTTYPVATGATNCFGYELISTTCKLAHGSIPPNSTPSAANDSACKQRLASNYAREYVTAYIAVYGTAAGTYASPGAGSLEKNM
jgi:hypothetical protein